MSRVGVVVIGRNEGKRLERCLASLRGAELAAVYVDSGSTDGSVEHARSHGWETVDLDLSQPFCAARARNRGFRELTERHRDLEFVQFVDGDCEIVGGWIDTAVRELEMAPEVAIVCGRVRERLPEASPYNLLCDVEWDTPVGEVAACGGIFLARERAFSQVGGFDPSVVAGEEPELCLRLRREGWRIRRISAEMALHDAALSRLGQWWSRAVRGGHAYAQGAALHGCDRERFCVRENLSIALWAAAWPLASLALARPTQGWSLLMAAMYPVLVARIALRQRPRGRPIGHAWLYACFCVLGKWPQHVGQWWYLIARWRGRLPEIIEHKETPSVASHE